MTDGSYRAMPMEAEHLRELVASHRISFLCWWTKFVDWSYHFIRLLGYCALDATIQFHEAIGLAMRRTDGKSCTVVVDGWDGKVPRFKLSLGEVMSISQLLGWKYHQPGSRPFSCTLRPIELSSSWGGREYGRIWPPTEGIHGMKWLTWLIEIR